MYNTKPNFRKSIEPVKIKNFLENQPDFALDETL